MSPNVPSLKGQRAAREAPVTHTHTPLLATDKLYFFFALTRERNDKFLLMLQRNGMKSFLKEHLTNSYEFQMTLELSKFPTSIYFNIRKGLIKENHYIELKFKGHLIYKFLGTLILKAFITVKCFHIFPFYSDCVEITVYFAIRKFIKYITITI